MSNATDEVDKLVIGILRPRTDMSEWELKATAQQIQTAIILAGYAVVKVGKEPVAVESCGCLFCDRGLEPVWQLDRLRHKTKHGWVPCTAP